MKKVYMKYRISLHNQIFISEGEEDLLNEVAVGKCRDIERNTGIQNQETQNTPSRVNQK